MVGEVDNSTEIAANMSDAEMDNFFNTQKMEDSAEQNQGEQSNENENVTSVRSERGTEQSSGDEERSSEPAERSPEDGSEEREDSELLEPSDGESRHERSYKAALKEERELRKQMQQELKEQRESAKKLAAAMEKLALSTDGKAKEPEVHIPDYDTDPIGHLNAKLELANKKIENIAKTESQIKQEREEQANFNRFKSDYDDQRREFLREAPDYMDAYNHLLNNIKDDYIAQGMTERQAIEKVNADEIALAAQQMMQRNNPAKVIYELAKRRGYQPKSAAPREGNSQDDAKKQAMEKMERMERGIKASRTMTNKGVAPNTRLSLEEISELPDDEFEKEWEQVLKMG